jgi:hypothetical protein
VIIRRRGTGLLAITQPDHARLAGVFAEAWRPPSGLSLVAASHRHDDGWIEWETAPTIDDQGRPHDFLTIPMAERVAIYSRGIDLLAHSDLYAGLLTSMHFSRLLAEGLGPLRGDARRIAESFLAEQVAWDVRARRDLGEPLGVEADYLVLRAVDYLSLLACMRPIAELDGTRITATMALGLHNGRVSLDPYPFGVDELVVSVPARGLGVTNFKDDEDYRAALAAAPFEELSFRLSRPRP